MTIDHRNIKHNKVCQITYDKTKPAEEEKKDDESM